MFLKNIIIFFLKRFKIIKSIGTNGNRKYKIPKNVPNKYIYRKVFEIQYNFIFITRCKRKMRINRIK
jgi:hypothetical protein